MAVKTSSQSLLSRVSTTTAISGFGGGTSSGAGIVISSVVYLAANGTPLIANAAPTSGNSVIKIIGSGFEANANVFLNGLLQASANVTFVDSSELRLNMPPLASNTYSLYTFNAAGAGAIFYSGVRFDPYPIWTTGEYTATGYVSTQLLVTGYGSGSISFSVASGNTAPSGLSLAANGLITGTTTEGTYNFYVNATDSENEITTQQITLTVVFPDTYFPYNTLLLSASSQTANNISTETFIDSSNYNNSLTIAAGTPYQGSFSPFPATGTWSNHFNFTSGSTYLSTSEAAISALLTGTAYTTIECWVNVPSFRTGPAAYNFPSILAMGNTWMNFGVENGYPKFYWYGTGASAPSLTSSIAITVNTWNHIAVVFNGSGSNNLKIYVNGVLGGTATFGLINGGGSPLYIGIEGDSPNSSYWLGYISNLRITNSALYTSNFTPSTTPLTAIANTTLLTCQSNRFIDNSTNAYTITTHSTVKVQRFNPFGNNLMLYSPSTNSGSIYFDYNSYMSIPNSAALQLDGAAWTIEMWIYPTDFTNYNVPLAKRGTGGDQYQVYLFGGTGVLSFYNGSTAVSSSTAPQLNAWNHIAYTHDGGTLKMFLNGVNVYSGAIVVPSGSAPLYIGTDSSGTYNFLGHLSNIRILKGTQLYTSGFTPPAEPLTAITNTSLLLLGANSKYYDSTKINNIKNVGGVATRTDIKNYGSNSWYFNGSSYLTMLNNPIFNFPKDFTIELWLYNVTTTFYGNIFSTTANYVTANGIRLTTGPSNNTFSVGIGNSGSVTGNTTFSNNTWVHVALVRSGTSLTLYQNGINIGSVTDSTAFISDTALIGTVGAVGGGGGPYNLIGYIQDFRVTNGIARYTTTFTPPTGPLPNS